MQNESAEGLLGAFDATAEEVECWRTVSTNPTSKFDEVKIGQCEFYLQQRVQRRGSRRVLVRGRESQGSEVGHLEGIQLSKKRANRICAILRRRSHAPGIRGSRRLVEVTRNSSENVRKQSRVDLRFLDDGAGRWPGERLTVEDLTIDVGLRGRSLTFRDGEVG